MFVLAQKRADRNHARVSTGLVGEVLSAVPSSGVDSVGSSAPIELSLHIRLDLRQYWKVGPISATNEADANSSSISFVCGIEHGNNDEFDASKKTYFEGGEDE